MFWVYLLGAIICCFFSWKKWGDPVKEKDAYCIVFEIPQFWYIVLITVFYPISLPIYAFWQVLELIYNKFKKEDEIN